MYRSDWGTFYLVNQVGTKKPSSRINYKEVSRIIVIHSLFFRMSSRTINTVFIMYILAPGSITEDMVEVTVSVNPLDVNPLDVNLTVSYVSGDPIISKHIR